MIRFKLFPGLEKKRVDDNTRTLSLPLVPIALVLAILKLAGIISWSWWWVFSPIWLPVTAFSAIFIPWMIIASIMILAQGGRVVRTGPRSWEIRR